MRGIPASEAGAAMRNCFENSAAPLPDLADHAAVSEHRYGFVLRFVGAKSIFRSAFAAKLCEIWKPVRVIRGGLFVCGLHGSPSFPLGLRVTVS